MAKTLEEAQITTKAARARLPGGIHWRAIDPSIHLGYRVSTRGGHWVVRWYVNGRYQQATIGVADDIMETNDVDCFSFAQAVSKAKAHVADVRRQAIASARGAPITVRSAVEAYIEVREKVELGRSRRLDTRNRMNKHVLSDHVLSQKELHELTEADLQDWRNRLPDYFARSTVMRVNNDLKAALNAAAHKYAKHFRELNAAHIGTVIKNGLAITDAVSPVARHKAILPDADIRRIVAAATTFDHREEWGGDFSRLILVLAATGARFSQIVRMTVADAQLPRSRLMVPVSHKGRGEKLISRVAVPIGSDVAEALRTVVAGRNGVEPLLLRPSWKQVTPTKWSIVGRIPWKTASELARPWKIVIVEAGLDAKVPPYALRHSSIVRALREGLPVRLVAALHDTSSAMIEKHYSAYIVSALDELAARAVISLESASVIQISAVAS